MSTHASRRLEIILKVSEACNIACDYCYYFFSGDNRSLLRPALVTAETLDGLVNFLNSSYSEGHFSDVQIDFHGGEPLLMGAKRFRALCELLRGGLIAPHKFCITTNAMLIDNDWIEIFSEFAIGVCVSLDGPEEVHDRRRRDHKQRGTYQRVILGIDKLILAGKEQKITAPSALCVVDPTAEGSKVYEHIVHVVGIKTLDFLMPDVTHDTPHKTPASVSAFMISAMRRWLLDDDPEIRVRTFRSALSLMTSGRSYLAGLGTGLALALTIGSDGQIDGDDFLKPCGEDLINTRLNIRAVSFEQVFSHDRITTLNESLERLPEDCLECSFARVCKGGQATHRFSQVHGFDNRSVYCQAHFEMFELATTHLLRTGVPAEKLLHRLSQ
jgi:uncharacterized protein